jgi:hypothetical protein
MFSSSALTAAINLLISAIIVKLTYLTGELITRVS